MGSASIMPPQRMEQDLYLYTQQAHSFAEVEFLDYLIIKFCLHAGGMCSTPRYLLLGN